MLGDARVTACERGADYVDSNWKIRARGCEAV
jgi:hypothetical protein